MLLHLQQISSKHSPIGCRARAARLCNAGRSARLGRVFEFLQAPVEIAGVDRPDKGVDHRRDPLRLARRVAPPPSAEVTAFIAAAMSWAFSPRALSRGGALDRRQCEFDRAFAARRQDAFEANPHPSRVAGASSTVGASTLRAHLPAMPPRQASPCCANRSGARPDCPTAPSRTAAHAPAPAVLVKAHQPCASPRFQSAAHSGAVHGREYAMRSRQYYG
jgi:hypothetical protein